jgi:hypothetical protein
MGYEDIERSMIVVGPAKVFLGAAFSGKSTTLRKKRARLQREIEGRAGTGR